VDLALHADTVAGGRRGAPPRARAQPPLASWPVMMEATTPTESAHDRRGSKKKYKELILEYNILVKFQGELRQLLSQYVQY
jgi:hypothetical protein